MDKRKKAAQYRKQMHLAVLEDDLTLLRRTMRLLYDEEEVIEKEDALAFAPFVEVAALCQVLNKGSVMEDETRKNVDYLREWYHVDDALYSRIREALSCISGKSVEEADAVVSSFMESTPLEGKVRVARHARCFESTSE